MDFQRARHEASIGDYREFVIWFHPREKW
jgi:hypothetical protein